MPRNKFIAALIGVVLLSACSTQVPVAVVAQQAPVSVPIVAPVSIAPVKWQVVNLSDLKALIAKIQAQSNATTVLFILTENDYKNLSLNLNDIARYITQQKAVVAMLESIIAERSATVDQKAQTK